jgi:Predicted transcriptional regulators
MKKKMQKEDFEILARYAKAMAHPTRVEILNFLAEREQCYFGTINDELPIAKATVSQHLKELKNSGLIQGEIEPPKVKYCINKEEWLKAKELFCAFFSDIEEKKQCCCK